MDQTNRMQLEKPAYLSNGELAVDAVNDNMDKIDTLITKVMVFEGNLLTFENELLITFL